LPYVTESISILTIVISHFVNLLAHSWHSFRNALGTTTLGFIAPLAVSVVSIIVTLYCILRQHGRWDSFHK
jgi:hypothetical protein